MKFRGLSRTRSLEDLQRLRAKAAIPPPFQREPPIEREFFSSDAVKFDLPLSLLPTSPKVKKTFPKFGDTFGPGGAERYAEAISNINEICDANAIGNGAGRHAVAQQLLRGSAKRSYEAFLRDLGNVTVANVNAALKKLGAQLFGRNYRSRQRDHLTGVGFRKPRKTDVQSHANRLSDIETKYEIVMGPNSLGLDEEMRKDIFLKSMPRAFQADFYTQPTDLADISFSELIAMFVRFEAAHQIMDGVLGTADESQHTSMPGRGAMRPATTHRGARGSGQSYPPHRQTGARIWDGGRSPQRNNYRRVERNAIRREAPNAVAPGGLPPARRGPYFENVYRTTGPNAYRNHQLREFQNRRGRGDNRNHNRREANAIERQPNPKDADSDVGF